MGAEASTAAGGVPGSGQPTSVVGGGAVGDGIAQVSAASDPHKPRQPSALVIVGPSGVGKGTLIQKLTEGQDKQLYGFSVSHTTRQPRTGEKHGEHYFFTTKEQFAKEVAEGRFLEYAEVHGNLYGTSIAAVRRVLDSGKVCILDIDVQGARSVRKKPLNAIFVFVAPPSLEDLARRLVGRGTESADQIQRRLNNAKAEINSLNEKGLYDYLIINDNLEEAVSKLKQIAARCAAGLPPEPGQVPESVVIEDAPLPDFAMAPSYPTDAAKGGMQPPATPAADATAASTATAKQPVLQAGSSNSSDSTADSPTLPLPPQRIANPPAASTTPTSATALSHQQALSTSSPATLLHNGDIASAASDTAAAASPAAAQQQQPNSTVLSAAAVGAAASGSTTPAPAAALTPSGSLPPHTPGDTATSSAAGSALPPLATRVSATTALPAAAASSSARAGGTPAAAATTVDTPLSAAAAAALLEQPTLYQQTAQQQQQLQQAPASAAAAALVAGMDKWAGRVALVTGASSGIGWKTCEALAQAGMRVVAVARRKERLEALQSHMLNQLGVPPSHFLPVVCDITKDAEVATLPRIVAKRWPEAGGVDVLVNNAGLSRSDASLFEGSVGSWVEMLSTNVLGTAMTTKAVLQDMRRRNRWGHIITMVGLSGHRIPDGPQGGGFYCATKSAVKTLVEGLRQEARGKQLPLRVTAISPGVVETEFFTVRAYGDEKAARAATSSFPPLQPADIASAVLWALASPEHMEVNDIVLRPTQQLI